MKGEAIYRKLISGSIGGSVANGARTVLEVLSKGYEKGVTYRNERFDQGKGVFTSSVPVISVGNITVGGTGKTPMVRYVCTALKEKNKRVAILSRGYKADDNRESIVVSHGGQMRVSSFVSGDEAWLLAKTLPFTSVVIGAKRAESAKIAVEKLGAEVLVLDDGFQHRALRRTLDVVLIDATNPFGYGHVLPRGLLREPLENLRRAHIIVITKANQASEEDLAKVYEKLAAQVPHIPVVETYHKNVGVQTLDAWMNNELLQELGSYREQSMLAVSGIGRPESFKASLGELGYKVVKSLDFGDHHEYDEEDLVNMWQQCFVHGIEAIITTEKDAVKLSQLRAIKDLKIPVYVLAIGIEFSKGEDLFLDVINKGIEG